MGIINALAKAFINNDSSEDYEPTNLLKQPGDSLEARVTDSNRQVLKISTNEGTNKYSATKYPNGTVVETRTTKK